MQLFFDTSAVVPMILEETHTTATQATWCECEQAWAWDWMVVEAEATLTRRKANAAAWRSWRILSGQFNLVSVDPSSFEALCAFNRSLGLRAADAGHLFVFDRLLNSLPDIYLLSFDEEQKSASERLSLPSFSIN